MNIPRSHKATRFPAPTRFTPGRHQNTTEQTANEYVDHPAMMAVRRPRQIEYSSPTGCADLCPWFTGRDRVRVMASLAEVGKMRGRG